MGFYYYKDGEKIGPVSKAELEVLAQVGKIKPDTRITPSDLKGYSRSDFCASDFLSKDDFDNLTFPRKTMRIIVLTAEIFYIPVLTFAVMFLFGRLDNFVGMCASGIAGVVLWILTVLYAARHKLSTPGI